MTKEKGGEEKSREHGRPVLADAPCADEAEADDEGDGREGVEEEGIECRKEEQVGCPQLRAAHDNRQASRGIGWRLAADGDNGGDDAKRGTIPLGRQCRHGGKAKMIGFLLCQ